MRSTYFPCCANSVRYFILLLAFLIVCSLYANILVYNLIDVYPTAPRSPDDSGGDEAGRTRREAPVGEVAPPNSQQQTRRNNFARNSHNGSGVIVNSPSTDDTLRTHFLTRGNPTYPPPSPTATLLTRSREEGQKRKSYLLGVGEDEEEEKEFGAKEVSAEKVLLQRKEKKSKAFAEERRPSLTKSTTTRRALPEASTSSTQPTTTASTPLVPNFTAPPSSVEVLDQRPSQLLNSLLRDLHESLPFVAAGLGILFAHYPCMLLMQLIGPGRLMAIVLLLSAVLTGVYPLVAREGRWAVWVLRFLLGVAFAPALPFIAMTAANWASVKEQLLFVLLGGFAAIQMAPVASWLIAQHFTESLLLRHDPSHVYWLHAAVSTLLMLVLLVFYRDTPQQHRWVRGIELNIIVAGKSPSSSRNNRHSTVDSGDDPATVTCPSVLAKSLSVWAVWLAAVGYFLAHTLLAQFLPRYIYTVLRQPLGRGMLVAPFVLLVAGHLVGYGLSKCLGTASNVKVRVMNTVGMIASALLFVALALLQPRGDWIPGPSPMLFLPFCLLPLGLFTTAGFINSVMVAGRAYSRLIFSHLQLILAATWIVVPLLVHFPLDPLGPNGPTAHSEGVVRWRLLFLLVALVLLISATVFAIFGSGRATGWAERSWSEDAAETKIGQTTPFLQRRESMNSDEIDCGVLEMKTLNSGNGH